MAKKTDKLVERMRKIMPAQEFENWLLDYNRRNAQEKSARRLYLQGFALDEANDRYMQAQPLVAGAQIPDGYTVIGDADLDGFDLIRPIKSNELKRSPDLPSFFDTPSDGWTGAQESFCHPRVVPFDPECDDDLSDQCEPAAVTDFEELVIAFEKMTFRTDRMNSLRQISDRHIEYHRCDLALNPGYARHNSRLGRPSQEIGMVSDFRRDAARSQFRLWQLGLVDDLITP